MYNFNHLKKRKSLKLLLISKLFAFKIREKGIAIILPGGAVASPLSDAAPLKVRSKMIVLIDLIILSDIKIFSN